LRRTRLFAQRAEHAALDVDVVAVEDLELLHLAVDFALLVMDVDIDDVDRTRDRAELAGDAAVVGEAEHPSKAIRRIEPLLRITDRHPPPVELQELAQRRLQPLEDIEQEKAIAPPMPGILDLHAPSSVSCSKQPRRS